jgi:CubicO group peptidase (beta-lactamase class C family)
MATPIGVGMGAVYTRLRKLAADRQALLRGDLLSPDSRRQLLRFVPAGDGYDGYGLGVGKGQSGTKEVWFGLGGGPGFVTVVSHVPAKEITVAVLSSGDADLRLLTTLLAEAAHRQSA